MIDGGNFNSIDELLVYAHQHKLIIISKRGRERFLAKELSEKLYQGIFVGGAILYKLISYQEELEKEQMKVEMAKHDLEYFLNHYKELKP